MSDDNKDFDGFRKDDGSTDLERSRNMGKAEWEKGGPCSGQQSWESSIDYQNRQSGYYGNK